MSVVFNKYCERDYDAVCDFLMELSRNQKNHINWNWARFEWMYEHPEFDKTAKESIGLWKDETGIIGAAIYDMYFGEAFCGVLAGYEEIYPLTLEYAYNELRDEAGMGIAICDSSLWEIECAKDAGYKPIEQSETIMSMDLTRDLPNSMLPTGYRIHELDPKEEAYDFQWILWQGFDHGEDRAVFEKEDKIVPQIRKHFDKSLSLSAVNEQGENVAYCCLWFDSKTDYAYVEPVCTAPAYRKKGISKALIYEALNRAAKLGAQTAYVISDMEIYEKLGFKKDVFFTFYHRA